MSNQSIDANGKAVVLRNEFASVSLSIDPSGNGDRLRIVDIATGAVAYLEPLELAALTKVHPDHLTQLFDQMVRPR